jgi:hypothetical protein
MKAGPAETFVMIVRLNKLGVTMKENGWRSSRKAVREAHTY